MTTDVQNAELIARCAEQNGVSPDVIVALVGLEREFPDFTLWGAKANFTRRVAQILDAAAEAADEQ